MRATEQLRALKLNVTVCLSVAVLARLEIKTGTRTFRWLQSVPHQMQTAAEQVPCPAGCSIATGAPDTTRKRRTAALNANRPHSNRHFYRKLQL